MKKIKTILLLLALSNLAPGLVADEKKCSISYEVMYQIAVNEYHPKRAVGYPYLISFNSKEDVVNPDGFEMLDNRTIDCKSPEMCMAITKVLIKNKITNVDLGAFQINYKHHKSEDLREFFDLNKSYAKACSFVEALVAENGWSWRTLGMYHSKTEKYNKRYVEKIQNRVYASN